MTLAFMMGAFAGAFLIVVTATSMIGLLAEPQSWAIWQLLLGACFGSGLVLAVISAGIGLALLTMKLAPP